MTFVKVASHPKRTPRPSPQPPRYITARHGSMAACFPSIATSVAAEFPGQATPRLHQLLWLHSIAIPLIAVPISILEFRFTVFRRGRHKLFHILLDCLPIRDRFRVQAWLCFSLSIGHGGIQRWASSRRCSQREDNSGGERCTGFGLRACPTSCQAGMPNRSRWKVIIVAASISLQ